MQIAKKKISNLLQFVPSSIGEAVIVTDLWTNVLFMNCIAEKLTGYSQTEAFGRTIVETFGIITKNTRELTKASEEVSNGAIYRFGDDTTLVTGSGETLSISGSISPVMNEGDEIIGFVIILYDVTEQRQLEKQLQHVSIQIAILKATNNKAESENFIKFLTTSDKGGEIFEQYGFMSFSEKLLDRQA